MKLHRFLICATVVVSAAGCFAGARTDDIAGTDSAPPATHSFETTQATPVDAAAPNPNDGAPPTDPCDASAPYPFDASPPDDAAAPYPHPLDASAPDASPWPCEDAGFPLDAGPPDAAFEDAAPPPCPCLDAGAPLRE